MRTQSGASQAVSDVLVGDVWLCSGQSNMELPVSRSLNAAREIAGAANDSIRVLSVAHANSPTPLKHFQRRSPGRLPRTRGTFADFSAACYYFARELQKSVPVPMGLIHSSFGGSSIEPWFSEAGLRALGGYDERLDLLRLYAQDPQAGMQGFAESMGALVAVARTCRLKPLENAKRPTRSNGTTFRCPCAIGKPGALPNSRTTMAWSGFGAA